MDAEVVFMDAEVVCSTHLGSEGAIHQAIGQAPWPTQDRAAIGLTVDLHERSTEQARQRCLRHLGICHPQLEVSPFWVTNHAPEDTVHSVDTLAPHTIRNQQGRRSCCTQPVGLAIPTPVEMVVTPLLDAQRHTSARSRHISVPMGTVTSCGMHIAALSDTSGPPSCDSARSSCDKTSLIHVCCMHATMDATIDATMDVPNTSLLANKW